MGISSSMRKDFPYSAVSALETTVDFGFSWPGLGL
jgi:hypothetical protein